MARNINNLEKLSLTKFNELVIDVLSKEGYQITRNNETNLIVGETKEGLSKITTTFFLYQKRLSGDNVNTKELIDKINLAGKETNTNQLIMLSGFSLSSSVKKILNSNITFQFNTIEREEFSSLIDTHFPNFWVYESFDLVSYEKYFLEEMSEKSSLLTLQGLEVKAKRLIEIYIKPRIFEV